MKMKEFSAKVNIPETTIRYYISNGIFIPERYTENYMGRKNYDFTENDVEQLKRIALLRKYDFSMKDIKDLSEGKTAVAEILQSKITAFEKKVESEKESLTVLQSALQNHPTDSDSLCELLNNPIIEQSPIPNIDDSSAYKSMYYRAKKAVKIALIAIIVLLVLHFLLIPFAIRSIGKNVGGNIEEVHVHFVSSEIHSQEEIDDAIRSAMNYFALNFKGCTLTDIEYAGDELTKAEASFIEREAENTIVLVSTFETGPIQWDAFEVNSTYSYWSWCLKKVAGKWVVVNYGYG